MGSCRLEKMGVASANSCLRSQEVRLCLTMIVRNEEAVIERCLRSCQSILDAVCITDTGSRREDKTKKLIRSLGEEFKLPTLVLEDQWEDFGNNRTRSALHARDFLSKLRWELKRSYLLLLDADMLLELKDFNKDSLCHEGYRMLQRGTSLVYSNVRLIRADCPWKCIGPTHEYWSLDNGNVSNLDTLTIEDRGDGGSKDTKFERDVSLLTKGLEQEPENPRYMFYLAESYRNSRQYPSAIDWYQKRIGRGGWEEETWYAHYMIGACYEALGQLSEAMVAYLDAYAVRPSRAEPLHDLARMWRISGKPRLGYFFAKRAREIPYPQGDVLFINHKVYSFLVSWELSICAFYMNSPKELEEGRAVSQRLLLQRGVNDAVRTAIHDNYFFYAEQLGALCEGVKLRSLPFTPPDLHRGPGSFYRAMNPSIIRFKDGYLVNVRTVNFRRDRHSCVAPEGDPVFRTRNFLLLLDAQFKPRGAPIEIIDNVGGEISRLVLGLEDIRLFLWREELWCTANSRISHDIPQIVLCALDPERALITSKQVLEGPRPLDSREKNWLPHVNDLGELEFIYLHEPYTLLRLPHRFYQSGTREQESRSLRAHRNSVLKCEIVQQQEVPFFCGHLRGGACPFPFQGGYLGVVHELILRPDRRVYLHRFAWYSADDRGHLQLSRISAPFYFCDRQVEYVCGACLSVDEKTVIVGLGIDDREAYLVTIPSDSVLGLLVRSPVNRIVCFF